MIGNIISGVIGFIWASISLIQILLILFYAFPIIKKLNKNFLFIPGKYKTAKKRYSISLGFHILLTGLMFSLVYFVEALSIRYFLYVAGEFLIYSLLLPNGIRNKDQGKLDVLEQISSLLPPGAFDIIERDNIL